jgi:2-oxoisovalerate dehydrogenase E1 component alpha subunit
MRSDERIDGMNSPLSLHVPHPPARPGDQADFSYLKLAPAGAAPRPAPLATVEETRPLAESLVRVLDDAGRAKGPWDPHLDAAELVRALRYMLLTRAMDDRLRRAQRQGQVSFYMQSMGEEAVSVAAAMALRAGDMLFPTYRNQGLHIARDRQVIDLMCQCLSNMHDMCKGRQMPVMYHWREGNIFSISGNLATQLPQAVGWAMAAAIKREDHIASAWTGEGSTAEADFHHALTFASVYRAPVILNVVNNQWAISTFQGVAGGEGQTFAARGPGFGVAGVRVDGNDVLAVYAVTSWAAERARAGGGPTLIEHVTYRAGPHSTSDDPSRYRPKDEWKAFPLGDPVVRLKQHLVALGAWTNARHDELVAEIDAHIAAEWKKAVAFGTLPESPLDPVTMFDDVFKERTPHLERQRERFLKLRN